MALLIVRLKDCSVYKKDVEEAVPHFAISAPDRKLIVQICNI